MRKRKSVLKPLAVIFVVIFLVNMAAMRIFFNINVIGAMALQEVLHSDMVRSFLSAAEDKADGQIETAESTSSVSQDNAPTGQGDESLNQDNAPTGQGDASMGSDTVSVRQDTTSTRPDTMPASADTEASLYVMSPGTVAALQHLSIIDKLAALSILSKMNREEINRIFEISNDGITFDEYEELRVLAESRLKLSDIEALKEIISKNQGLFAQNSGE